MTLQKRRSRSSPSSVRPKRKPGSIKKARRAVALAEIKDDLSKYLRLAEDEEIFMNVMEYGSKTHRARTAGDTLSAHDGAEHKTADPDLP